MTACTNSLNQLPLTLLFPCVFILLSLSCKLHCSAPEGLATGGATSSFSQMSRNDTRSGFACDRPFSCRTTEAPQHQYSSTE